MNNKRVLVVDDSYYMRTVLGDILSDAGYTVVGEAPDRKTAIKLAMETSPDVVTLDVVLEDENGLDTLKEIKKAHPSMRVVMVSANGQQSFRDEALDSGASAYIVKPFSPEAVVAALEKVTHN